MRRNAHAAVKVSVNALRNALATRRNARNVLVVVRVNASVLRNALATRRNARNAHAAVRVNASVLRNALATRRNARNVLVVVRANASVLRNALATRRNVPAQERLLLPLTRPLRLLDLTVRQSRLMACCLPLVRSLLILPLVNFMVRIVSLLRLA